MYKQVHSFVVRRFPDCFKRKAPYNALCLLNPSNTDLYFDEDEVNEAIGVIKLDSVYFELRDAEAELERNAPPDTGGNPDTDNTEPVDRCAMCM